MMEETKEDNLTADDNVIKENSVESCEVLSKSEDVFKVPTILPIHVPLKSVKIDPKSKLSSIEAESDATKVESSPASNNSATINSSAKLPVSTDKPKVKENIPINYKEPKWSGVPKKPYSFEVIKNGVIVENVDLSSRAFTVCGRLANCDVVMEHPSISRYHAVIQYRCVEDSENTQPEGFYLYDLDSTHGTQINKNAVRSRTYYRLHVGHLIKFGGSSRNYVLQGPSEDEEEESPLTVTEIKEKRIKEENERKIEEEERVKKLKEEDEAGVNWGMGDDAEEDESSDINPFAVDNDYDDSYFDDPKKTLRGWFEREGYDLQYNVEEIGQAQFLCKVNLPLDNASGGSVTAEAKVKGKKKEAVAACALEACRILDKHGVLRQAAKSRRVVKKSWEDDDYYDSDEDTFLDRTGTVERKRLERIRKAGKAEDVVETYDSLLEKHKKVVDEISELEATLHATKKREEAENEDEDSLEAYMKSIKSDKSLDKSVKTNIKHKIAQLKVEEKKLERLIKIAKPANLPSLVLSTPPIKSPVTTPTIKSPVTSPTILNQPQESIPRLPSPKKSSVVKSLELAPEEIPKVVEKSEPAAITESNDQQPKPNDETVETAVTMDIEQIGKTQPKSEKRKESQEKKVNKKAKLSYEYDSSNPDYHMWIPPDDQSGDGKTKLNEKFGY